MVCVFGRHSVQTPKSKQSQNEATFPRFKVDSKLAGVLCSIEMGQEYKPSGCSYGKFQLSAKLSTHFLLFITE